MAGVRSMSEELVVQKSIVHIDKEESRFSKPWMVQNFSMSTLHTQISKELVKLSLILGANRRFACFVSSVRSSSGYHGLIEIRNPLFQILQILK